MLSEEQVNLNFGTEPAVGVRWGRPRAAMLANVQRESSLRQLPATDGGFQLGGRSVAGFLALRCPSVLFCSVRLPVLPTHGCADQKRQWKRTALCKGDELRARSLSASRLSDVTAVGRQAGCLTSLCLSSQNCQFVGLCEDSVR